MATQRRFEFRVVGEGTARANGVLAFVVAQAIDLLAHHNYTVSIRERPAIGARGVLRLSRDTAQDGGLVAVYEANPNQQPLVVEPPGWCLDVETMSRELGRNITWQTPSSLRT